MNNAYHHRESINMNNLGSFKMSALTFQVLYKWDTKQMYSEVTVTGKRFMSVRVRSKMHCSFLLIYVTFIGH